MKALVVFDSMFGNTAQVARAIGEGIGSADPTAMGGGIPVKQVGEVQPDDLVGLTLLAVGSPTRGFRPTPAIVTWLKGLPAGKLQGVRVAAFDTRIDVLTLKSRLLGRLLHLFGYAAPRILRQLVRKGGTPILPPEGFIVLGTEGPLKEGELPRGTDWGRKLTTV